MTKGKNFRTLKGAAKKIDELQAQIEDLEKALKKAHDNLEYERLWRKQFQKLIKSATEEELQDFLYF